jgi:hypothetical protein
MSNPYVIQSIGLVITAVGILALIAFTTLYGRPLSDDERIRMGEKRRDRYRLPINLETLLATVILLGGVGILYWSKFDPCLFIGHWVPNLPDTIMASFQCK